MAGFSHSGAMPHYASSRSLDGRDVGIRSAFSTDDTVTFFADAPHTARSAALLFTCDMTGKCYRFPMLYLEDRFSLTLPMSSLCENGQIGLYSYTYRVETEKGYFDLRRDPHDFSEYYADASDGAGDFRLFVYEKREVPPSRFYGGVMYQIFPDRFHSSERFPAHEGAVLCRDRERFPSLLTDKKKNDRNDLFFGGDLRGIEEKLPYLASLGVSVLYLNPIFSAPSSHRYNTADYMTVDAMLGGEETLSSLIQAAKKAGIDIILDGVFNHTGDDSLYFNAKGTYDTVGAANSDASPYAKWYNFTHFPDDYESWWGIMTLPRIKSDEKSYRDFLFSENGVLRHYMRLGIAGWRLDVADELSDDFLAELYRTAREEKADALVLGEVWENAAEKISYGVRKKYLCGREMDSVMNYPVRTALIDYLTKGDFMALRRTLTEIYGIYPPEAQHTLMNILGTHDTPRILTELGDMSEKDVPYASRSTCKMEDRQRESAKKRLMLAATVQMTLPGIPSVYYGDEAGMEGFGDPFCRMPYPWSREDEDILSHYRALGRLRRENDIYKDGEIALVFVDSELLCFERIGTSRKAVTLINRSENAYTFHSDEKGRDMLSGQTFCTHDLASFGYLVIELPNDSDYSVLPQWKGSEEW